MVAHATFSGTLTPPPAVPSVTFTSLVTPSENRRDHVYLTSHTKREQT